MNRLVKFSLWMLLAYALVVVAAVALVNSQAAQRRLGSRPRVVARGSLQVGERARIQRDRGSVVVVRTDAGWREFMTLAGANDDRGIALMVFRGRAFLAEPGTLVHIIDRGFDRRRVRVLEGPTENQDGWVSTKFLKPL